jgi:hypothetical protein
LHSRPIPKAEFERFPGIGRAFGESGATFGAPRGREKLGSE